MKVALAFLENKNCLMCLKCGIYVTPAVVGGKWKASILWHFVLQPMRFSDLQRRFSGTTQKMLTQQLRAMKQQRLSSGRLLN